MTTQSNGSSILVQGRLVWTIGSSVFEGKQKKDFNTNQLKIGADGNPIVEYGFGLAIPKNSEVCNKVFTLMQQEALTLFPSGQIPPGFAMKFKDGDSVDPNGVSYAQREGYAGHYVLACTTQIPINWFIYQGGNNVLVNTGIKCGDYVNVQLNIKAHPAKGQGKSGLYLNPSAVQLIQEGKEIINTPSGDQIFGQNAPAYGGQVVAPVAPAMPNMQTPAIPNVPAQQQAPAMPQTPAAPVPHYQVLPQGMQPQGMPQTPVQPAAPVPTPGLPQNNMPTPMGNGYVQNAVPSNSGLPQAIPSYPNNGMPQ